MATGTLGKPAPAELDEEQRLRVQLAQLVMDLVKTMTKTGYYDPNHPQARQARAGLHAQFRTLIKDRFELGFVRAASAENPEIVVEGVLLEPLTLTTLMGKGAGSLFVPKFYEYFERHALQSFAINANITQEEFDGLIDAITREPGVGRGAGTQNLGEVVIERQIFHVSMLFSDELVARERRMNWRIRLGLSRLKKDLRLVPLYQKAGEAALRHAKHQIVEDVVRPLRRPDLLSGLLTNCDVVVLDPSLIGEIPLERQVIETLPPLLIAPTLAATTKDVAALAQAAGGMDHVPGAPRLRHLLVDLADRAHAISGEGTYEALTGLFQARLLNAIDLSPTLKQFLQVRKFAEGLAANPVAGLAQLREALAKPGGAAVGVLGPLLAELLRREPYGLACDVLRLAREVPGATRPVAEVLGRNSVIRPLLQKFVAGSKETRERVADVFVLIGPPAMEPLIELFAQSSERGVRRAACATVARFGAAAVGPLLDRLERPNLPWYVIRNILMVLGEMGQPVPLDFRRYIRHEHQRVREEAVATVARLPMPESEALLLNALRDPLPSVRARAVAGLGRLKTKNIGALHFMVEAIRAKKAGEKEEDEAVQLQACSAFQHLGNIRYGGDGRVDTILAEALVGPGKRGFLRLFGGGGGRPKGPAVRAAILETLATIGTAASAEALHHVAESEPGPLAARAREALPKVQARPA